jgi:hypothetical protein
MFTFCLHTLVDITENGQLKQAFPFKTKSNEVIHNKDTLTIAKNQQANFTTLIQALQLRGNIVWEREPIRINENVVNMRFGDAYEGKHLVWNFMWQVEQSDVYAIDNDQYGQLKEDFNMIPVINFCKETATFPASAFITKDSRFLNTYFSFVPEENK